MDIPLEKLESEMLSLPQHERARLAQRLLASLEEDPAVMEAWEEEAERRFQLYLAGEMKGYPADQVIAEARARLKR
jgi:putative addiction module component (TIGR02574 family)